MDRINSLESKNSQEQKIVLVGGCFDILHYGHVSFLTAAKKLGDVLIVLLESDENVQRRKGPNRPIHTESQRKEILESLTAVDQVISLPTMTSDADYQKLVEEIRPSVIAITEGDPYRDHKEKQAASIGAIVVEIPKIHTHSTSQLVKLLELE